MHRTARAPTLRLSGAVIGHGRRAVAGPIDLSVAADDFLVVAGPNGAGKSTLIETLLGVLPPLSGTAERGRIRFGYVPQRERLDDIWPFSALEMALMGRTPGLAPFGFFGRDDRRRVLGILERVGLGAEADRPFRSLSGGQQQRALIARALAAEPDVLVLDEPTNHLDVPGERAVWSLLGEIHRQGDLALVAICHHLPPALVHATRLAVLRDGGIQVGEPSAMVRSGALGDLVDDGFTLPALREVAP